VSGRGICFDSRHAIHASTARPRTTLTTDPISSGRRAERRRFAGEFLTGPVAATDIFGSWSVRQPAPGPRMLSDPTCAFEFP